MIQFKKIDTFLLFFCLILYCNHTYSQKTNPEILSLIEIADSSFAKKDLTKYPEDLKALITLSEKEKDTINELKAYRRLLDYYQKFNKNQSYFDFYYTQSINRASVYDNDKYLANYVFILAKNLTETGKYTTAYNYYKNIEEEVVTNNYDFLPDYYSGFARLHYYLKELDLAFDKLKKAGKIYKNQGQLVSTSANYNNLGILYKSQAQYDSSLVYHQKSLNISKQLKDTVSIAYSYNNMGFTHFLNEKPIKAEEYYTKALNINPKNPSKSLLNNYSELLLFQSKYDEAEKILLSIVNETENPETQLDALKNLVALKKMQKQYAVALVFQDSLISKKEKLLNTEKVKVIERLKATHNTQQKEKQILLLEEETQNQELLINQNRLIAAIVTIAFLLLAIIGGLVWRNKSIKEQTQQELLKQQLLRSQMNPHFIFNALSNIQSTILKNENEKAVGYLAKFSKLVRGILENSKHSSIVFENEIDALISYLELQKARFTDSLEYEIEIDEKIETEITYIPTMLFQPLIENAIEHGIESVENGKVTINFKLKDNHIKCTVIDNGIGYSKTQGKSNLNKQSMSSGIIKNRLELFSKKLKQPFTFSIGDIIINNEIKGTKAVIDIPIINED